MSPPIRRLLLGVTSLIVLVAGCTDSTGPDTRTLVVTPTQTTLQIGETVQLTASFRDGGGNLTPASGVVWTSSDMGVAGVSATGEVSGAGIGGPMTITATVGTSTARAEVTVTSGPPSQLSIETQPDSVGASGVPLARQPVIRLLDVDGNPSPAAGIEVAAVVAQGNGTLSDATATTDSLGRATFTSLTITGTVGTYGIRFESPDLDSVTSEAVLLGAGPAASVTIDVEPSAVVQSGVEFPTQPRIVVRDAQGNLVEGASVTAGIATGQGTLGGTVTVATGADGVVAFSDLLLTGPVGDVTLDFTAGSASAESGTITVEAGAPASLLVVTQPSSSAQSGVPFDRQPVVEVRDGAGNPVAGVDVLASVSSGAATVGGTATVSTDGLGLATYGDLSLIGTAGEYTLVFDAAGASVVSDPVTLAAGVPSTVTITQQPSSTAQSGVELLQQPVVEVRDAQNNVVPGHQVTATIASGGGSLGGTTTVSTDAGGVATFTDLTISGPVGAHTLEFIAGSASSDPSNTITLEPGPLDALVVTVQPPATVTNDEVFPQQPVVRAEDGSGNAISGVDVTAEIDTGGGTLGGTLTLNTDGSGEATFTDLKVTGTVGMRTLRFFNGAISVTSSSIDVVAGDPALVVITTQPPDFALDGVTFTSSTVVEVEDVSGNAVAGADVTATIASGGGLLGGTTTVATDGSGSATFSSLSIDTSADPGARTLQFASNGAQAESGTVHIAYSEGSYFDVQYCGTDAEQRMDVFVPSNTVARPLPVGVFVHGGGWVAGDKATSTKLVDIRDELLSRGYVVVSLNYRLATPSTNQWPAQIHDVKCAVRHLRAEADDYGFDGVRIGAWGSSAGGHLVDMLGVTDAASGFEGSEGYGGWSSRVDAVVPIGGITDLTQGPTHPELDFSGPEDTFDSWPGPDPELTDASPITWASADDPAFLIVHGEEDVTVLPAQATRLRDYLDAAGATVTLQLVANADHQLQDVGGAADPSFAEIVQQVADFFDTYVKNGT